MVIVTRTSIHQYNRTPNSCVIKRGPRRVAPASILTTHHGHEPRLPLHESFCELSPQRILVESYDVEPEATPLPEGLVKVVVVLDHVRLGARPLVLVLLG